MTDQPAIQADTRVNPVQTELPFAVVEGKPVTEIPKDLYIPPEALEVFLEAFEGPLDLLLYLIRRQNVDILLINVADITEQYMAYIALMDSLKFELAAEYLVMAAMLAEIKSRMLLPRSKGDEDEEEEDPRAELIRRLQEYEQFKMAAENLDEVPRVGRDNYTASEKQPDYKAAVVHPDVDLRELFSALSDVLQRVENYTHHKVTAEVLSTRARMSQVLDHLQGTTHFIQFEDLFDLKEGRLGVVVTFLAVLELVKESLVELVQNEQFGSIHVRTRLTAVAEDTVSEIDDKA